MNKRKTVHLIINNLIWILLLLVFILFALLSDRFLLPMNLMNILVHATVLGILVVGQSFVLITGNFDLSAESTLGLAALIGAWFILPKGAPTYGGGLMFSPYVAIVIMLFIGLAIGWINGFLITRLKMNNFIVTLAMLLIIRGVMMPITAGNTMARLPATFRFLGHGAIGPVPVPVIGMLLAFAIGFVVLRYRPFGRSLYAVGGARNAALAAGIDPDKRIRQAYLISGAIAAVAGLMLAGRTGVIVQNMGRGLIFEVMAACVIGGISLQGGRGSMIGAFGGVLLLSTINSGLSLLRISTFWIEIASGAIILVAMLIDAQKIRYFASQSTPLTKVESGQPAASTATTGD
jgi:simple sugar transport system permease protein